MAAARVSSRGQVTLPAGVRRQLGIDQGDDLLIEVDVTQQVASFRVIKRKRLSEYYRSLQMNRKWKGKSAEVAEVGEYLASHAERPQRRKAR